MRTAQGQVHRFKSKDVTWANAGRGDAVFDGSYIPDQGPRGGVMVIDRFIATGQFNLTAATAVIQGEDLYRLFRAVTLTQVDGEKRYDGISGDALRLISYAHEGAVGTIEHEDFAISTGDVTVTASIPLAKPFAFESDDTSLPAYMFKELRIGMAQIADLALGASVVTINSGSYSVIAECREEMGAVLHATDCWTQTEFDAPTSGTIAVNGRPQDLYLFVRGASGGASLANVTSVNIPTENIYNETLLRGEIQQAYARARGQACNSFAAVGSPLTTDPFVAASAGTLRALAPLLCEGAKVHDMPEVKSLQVKTSLGGALSLVIVARSTKRISAAAEAKVRSTHKVNAAQLKTAGKSKRTIGEWDEALAAYMPKKFFTVAPLAGARGGVGRVPTRLFSGRKP